MTELRSDGTWTQVTARVLPEYAEDLADLLDGITGNGVVVEPPIEALGPDEGYVLDYVAPVTLRAYFEGKQPETARRRVRHQISRAGLSRALSTKLAWSEIREVDWAEAWKEHYRVQVVGIVAVRPRWLDYEPGPGEIVISLDPGMAFGTGQHETTRLCLLEMQSIPLHGARVLDLGTGSGILALAAIGLGASEVVAADIEEQAVAATSANAELNGVTGRLQVIHGSLVNIDLARPFDVVLANIHSAAIIRIAGELSQALRPGGTLIASGIIEQRADEARMALVAAGFQVTSAPQMGEWRAFACLAQGVPA